MNREYDGWLLHTGSVNLARVLPLCPEGVRLGAWVKSFASFKPNVTTAYAWEPVIFKAARGRARALPTVRDWVSCPITLRRGLTGAKPDAVCRWGFQLLGLEPVEDGDELHDLFPGTGAVGRAWDAWRGAPVSSLAEGVQSSLGGF